MWVFLNCIFVFEIQKYKDKVFENQIQNTQKLKYFKYKYKIPVLLSSRTSPWPRGHSRTYFEGLGLGLGLESQGLGLGLGLESQGLGLGLGLERQGLGLERKVLTSRTINFNIIFFRLF